MFAAWGANWPQLQSRFAQVPAQVTVSGASATLTVTDPDARPDALLLDLQCAQPPSVPATVTWTVGDGSEYGRAVPMQPGRSLIPLGAFPSWHDDPQTERFSVTAPEGCTVGEAPQLLRLER